MPRNDIVLLDSLVTKARLQLGEQRRESEIFELFCFDQVLKDYELSYEELESGWTDGPDDGGVDGFFVFLDGHLVSEPKGEHAARWNPTMSVTLFTVRHSDSFQQEPLNALCGSLPELVDFRKTEGELRYPFRTELLAQRALFRKLFVSLADRRPKLHLRVCYCCRGDTSTLADNIVTRAERAKETIREFFSELDVTVELLGATELLAIARRQKTYTLRLRFLESYISREGKNYVILVSLPNYFRFVTDEQGQLRRYLFDSNVRDYLGQVQINRDIDQTLDRECAAVDEDFWWLNNGVTILATHAMVIGKELAIESVQIVNGLQTTESIYQHFTRTGLKNDDRAILVKILLATDENTRGRIIKATNYQNTVDLANLRGLDKIQIDIDHFLAEKGWFYDRRKNFYKNQGRPAERIISIPYLAAAVRAIALRDPARSQRQRSKSLRDEKVYKQVFNPRWDLNVYLASLEITRAVESALLVRRTAIESPPIALVHYVAFVYACSRLGKCDYRADETAALAGSPPGADELLRIRDELAKALGVRLGKENEVLRLKKDFVERFVFERYGGGSDGRHVIKQQ